MFGKFSSGMDKRREEDEPFVDEADFIAYLEVFVSTTIGLYWVGQWETSDDNERR